MIGKGIFNEIKGITRDDIKLIVFGLIKLFFIGYLFYIVATLWDFYIAMFGTILIMVAYDLDRQLKEKDQKIEQLEAVIRKASADELTR